MSLQRRSLLALGGALLTGGCLGFGDCSNGVYVDAEPFAPVDALDDALRDHERAVAADAVENDGTRLTSYQGEPFREPTLVAHGGAFYRLTRETVETVEVPAFDFAAEWENGQTPPDGVELVPVGDLPENDRRAFLLAMPTRKGEQFPSQGFSVGKFPAPYPEGGEGSRLVGSTTWVEWEDRVIRVEVAGEQTGTTERVTYEYTAERVADDAEAFRAYLDERYLVDLSDAPASQLELLRSAAGEESYEECLPASDALAGLRDRLENEAPLPEPYSEDWYVAFDGDRYRLEIVEWVV